MDVRNNKLSELIGTSIQQIKIARDGVQVMLDSKSRVRRLQRQFRKDRIREKLEPYAFDFCKDDDFSRLDSNQKLVEVINPRSATKVTEHQRVWINGNKNSVTYNFWNQSTLPTFNRRTGCLQLDMLYGAKL